MRAFWLSAVLLLTGAVAARPGDVLRARVDQAIGPASAQFMIDAITQAERDDMECVVFELDTPGGLDESMRSIVKRIMSARVPVVLYVAPSGARAASAGAFITMAAHVAAMAPGTTIGAAHPVSLLGGSTALDTNMSAKVANDAAAYIRSIAEKRHRNAAWAESAVRESVALSETEALTNNVVDLLAPSFADLLQKLDGRTVTVNDRETRLATRGASVVNVEMSWRERLLATLSDPNIAYILFMLGLLGLYFELATPGAILPGVVGTICLLLAFFSFQTLPVNYAGVALIVLSVVLFIVDVKAATHGVLTIGGLVAMFIGSVMLFKASPVSATLSMHVVIPVVAATASFFAIGAWLSLRAMRRRPTTGHAGLLELEGDARTDIAPAGGTVFVAGTHWTAVSRGPIGKGTRIRVTAVKGMILEVEAVPGPGAKP